MHLCEIRTERDVDWAVNRVLLGDRVVAHVGGLRSPRRHQLNQKVALCCLESRIESNGGQVLPGQCANAMRRLTRGRTGLLLPPERDDGDMSGVREPRRPTPNPSAGHEQPEHTARPGDRIDTGANASDQSKHLSSD